MNLDEFVEVHQIRMRAHSGEIEPHLVEKLESVTREDDKRAFMSPRNTTGIRDPLPGLDSPATILGESRRLK